MFSKVKDRRPKKVYYQTETRNKSFIKMWALLEAKGIENNLFFLKTYNKHLLTIDPYDDDLTTEEKSAVFEECTLNKWYYIREVFRLPENGSAIKVGGGIRFQLHRSNLAQIWASELNINSFTVAPRQTGKTLIMHSASH
jgi:hypothetical protein